MQLLRLCKRCGSCRKLLGYCPRAAQHLPSTCPVVGQLLARSCSVAVRQLCSSSPEAAKKLLAKRGGGGHVIRNTNMYEYMRFMTEYMRYMTHEVHEVYDSCGI